MNRRNILVFHYFLMILYYFINILLLERDRYDREREERKLKEIITEHFAISLQLKITFELNDNEYLVKLAFRWELIPFQLMVISYFHFR